jgi:UrcA family protein
MDTPRNKALGSVVACILCGVSGLVDAGQPTEIVVTYADLDLNNHYGVTTMYARLEAAANTVCAAREGPWSHHRISSCVDYTMRQAVVQIGAPQLVILYETRTGHVVEHARR